MIRVGHLNLNESMKDTASSQDIFIENVIVHENYSQSPVINDIALIKLQHAAKISRTVFFKLLSSILFLTIRSIMYHKTAYSICKTNLFATTTRISQNFL